MKPLNLDALEQTPEAMRELAGKLQRESIDATTRAAQLLAEGRRKRIDAARAQRRAGELEGRRRRAAETGVDFATLEFA